MGTRTIPHSHGTTCSPVRVAHFESRTAATSGGPITLFLGPPGAGKTMLARRLAGTQELQPAHLAEAIQYCSLDRRVEV